MSQFSSADRRATAELPKDGPPVNPPRRAQSTALQQGHTLGGCALVGALLSANLVTACGANSTEDELTRRQVAASIETTRRSEYGAPTGQGGVPGAGGSGTGGPAPVVPLPDPVVPVDPNSPSGPPQECNGPRLAEGIFGTPAPMDGLLVDFSTYNITGPGRWGDPARAQLAGGTSLYSGAPEADLVQAPAGALPKTPANDALQVKATIPVGGYSGVVLWFSPCVNATAFAGISFTATGDLSGATLLLKVQTSPDYPVDSANLKGKCQFMTQASMFTDCVEPTATITSLGTGSFSYAWSDFTGGSPLPSVDPAQLLGFELQLQCPGAATAPCNVDVSLGTIRFAPLP
jgi:hypothetical protein